MKKVGVIGCGSISSTYFENMVNHFSNLEVLACADMFLDKAVAAKEKYGLQKACTVEALLADPEIDIVVNLTVPAAHYEVNTRILKAGKHVYCEKPMALRLEEATHLVELAGREGLRIGNAPDTFMGPGIQRCREMADSGAIGEVFGFTANLVSPGHELWHPGPDFYYQEGAGPMLDMGPYYLTALVSILGPIESICCYATKAVPKRQVQDHEVAVEVNTHYTGILKFRSGAIGNLNMSFDVWDSDLPGIEIYGTQGKMTVPDPNKFNGEVSVIKAARVAGLINSKTDILDKLGALYGPEKKELVEAVCLPYDAGDNMRGLGVAEMAAAIEAGRPHRATGELARHVLEALIAFDASSRTGAPYHMTTTCARPAPISFEDTHWVGI